MIGLLDSYRPICFSGGGAKVTQHYGMIQYIRMKHLKSSIKDRLFSLFRIRNNFFRNGTLGDEFPGRLDSRTTDADLRYVPGVVSRCHHDTKRPVIRSGKQSEDFAHDFRYSILQKKVGKSLWQTKKSRKKIELCNRWLIDWLSTIDWLIDCPRLIDWLTMIDWLIDCVRLIDWLIDCVRLIDWLIDWLSTIDWLIDCLRLIDWFWYTCRVFTFWSSVSSFLDTRKSAKTNSKLRRFSAALFRTRLVDATYWTVAFPFASAKPRT